MSRHERLRARLVQAAVRDNLDCLRGVRPRPLRRRRRLLTALGRAGRRVGAPLLLLAGVALVASASQTPGHPGQASPPLSALAARLAATPLAPAHLVAFPLPVRRIALDPGHGGQDPGAVAATGLAEKDVTLDVARRLAALLRESGLEVVLTRDDDRTVSLRERVRVAGASRADVLVSVHVNATPGEGACGIETYHAGPADDPRVAELARTENQDSGYVLADLRWLLEGLYVRVRQDASRHLAEALQRGLASFFRPARNGGVKAAPFLVLVASQVPGALVELGCLTNDAQARALADPLHRHNLARGLFVGLRAFADAPLRLAASGSAERGIP